MVGIRQKKQQLVSFHSGLSTEQTENRDKESEKDGNCVPENELVHDSRTLVCFSASQCLTHAFHKVVLK